MDAKRRQQLTLVATILGSGVALLDATIVNVALPSIERDLGGGLAGQQWVVNGYLLTLGSLILIGGSLGDLYGERRIFALGVGGFGAASLLAALAPSIELLVAFRALQGIAGALLTPASLAVIVEAFPNGKERGSAIGTWTAWGGIATVVGPLAGGWILGFASWRWIFAVNVPLVLVTLALIRAAVGRGEPQPARGRRLDLVGALLTAAGLAAPVFALVEQPKRGWADAVVAGGLAGGAVVLAGFVLWERRARDPMLPLGLFRRRNFAFANAETLLVYAALSALFFFLTIYLQQVVGWTPLESGLAGAPVPALLFVLSRRMGKLAARFGPRLFMGSGPVVAAAGALLLARVGKEAAYAVDVLPALLLFGVGVSLTVAPLTATVLADAGRGDSGIASGVNNAVARVAGLLGIAVVGLAVAGRSAAGLDTAGFRLGMVVIAALLAAGGLLGFAGIRNPSGAARERLVSSPS